MHIFDYAKEIDKKFYGMCKKMQGYTGRRADEKQSA
jgi:hypothetical protein